MWHKSMYGVGPGFTNLAGDPFSPIGPDIANQNEWWFRGSEYRALKPHHASVMELPVGTSVDVEIACNVAWTTYGARTTDNSAELSACPENYGAYHSGDPAGPVDESMLSGCALAVADKDDIEQVGWDDLVVFSVNHNCVKQRVTPFEIPSRMPACSGEKCICAWLWLANNGTGNFYMTGFDCKFTGVDPKKALLLLPPIDPVFCAPGNESCRLAVGAKRPLYAYNQPTNVEWQGNDDRPGYHASWSFPKNGAQEDIFDTSSLSSLGELLSTVSQSRQTDKPLSSSFESATAPSSLPVETRPQVTSARTSAPRQSAAKPTPSLSTTTHVRSRSRTSTSVAAWSSSLQETKAPPSASTVAKVAPTTPSSSIHKPHASQRKRPQNLGGIMSEMRALQRLMLPSLTERSTEERVNRPATRSRVLRRWTPHSGVDRHRLGGSEAGRLPPGAHS
ncbi:hypothetical protein RHOSPDRAFT_34138 [Rhodotorula sp. JG-1b]|nr:hypothetical protein RHOSPDRAFT_34138 [Rhodotorula sp. JG-1b]